MGIIIIDWSLVLRMLKPRTATRGTHLVLKYIFDPSENKMQIVLPSEISLFTVELAHYYKPTKISIGVYTQL